MNTPVNNEATYISPITFNMKGNWESDDPLPEEGAEPGDCWIVKKHFWARNSLNKWVDYGEVSHTNNVQAIFLQDHHQAVPLAEASEKFLQDHYHEDVRAGYGGTFEQWRSQNGDLNALLRDATPGLYMTSKSDITTPSSVEQMEEQRLRMHKRDLLAEVKEHPSLDDVSSILEGALTKLETAESDAAFKALDALKKVKVDLRVVWFTVCTSGYLLRW